MKAATVDRKHYFGATVNGKLGVFSGGACIDAEFESVTKNGLPMGWVSWHLEPGENSKNSERVKMIRSLPVLIVVAGSLALLHHDGSGLVRAPYPVAAWREFINA
tara:strand:+ start:39 stop:353 length:315 start_codon:yes stop_codon:yes gene_type:complete